MAAFRAALDMGRRAGDPPAAQWQHLMANSLDGIAGLNLQADHVAEARAGYRAALEIRRALAAQAPDNPAAQAELVTSLYTLSRLEDTAPAIAAVQEALVIVTRLAGQGTLGPEQESWPDHLRERLAELEGAGTAPAD